MKKIISIIVLSLTFLACSSSDDDDNDNYNVFFNFTEGSKDYSKQETYEGIDPCWFAQVKQNGEVIIMGKYTNPDEGLTYCGVGIELTDSQIGTHNDAFVTISMGGDAIYHLGAINFELTSNGEYYEGSFSGEFVNTNNGQLNFFNGSGSFKIPKIEF